MTKCKSRKIKRLQCYFLAVSNNSDIPQLINTFLVYAVHSKSIYEV